MKQRLSWIGASVEDCVVESLIGEGAFSWVYGAIDSNNVEKAIKAAKPADQLTNWSAEVETGTFPTKAMLQLTGAVAEFEPDTSDLLRIQAERIKAANSPWLPPIGSIFTEPGLGYYIMPLFKGVTLRELMRTKPVPIDVLITCSRGLHELQANSRFYHGDLKPENILLVGSTVVFIDPGHFGTVKSNTGKLGGAAITTPAYYPELMANDLLAFGIILWEIAFGDHPLRRRPDAVPHPATQNFQYFMRAYMCTGKHYLDPLASLPLPQVSNPKIDPALSNFLLKALGVRLAEGKLDMDEGFASFAEITQQLEALKSGGHTNLTAI